MLPEDACLKVCFLSMLQPFDKMKMKTTAHVILKHEIGKNIYRYYLMVKSFKLVCWSHRINQSNQAAGNMFPQKKL